MEATDYSFIRVSPWLNFIRLLDGRAGRGIKGERRHREE
jgi:hypothetical protein